MLPKKAAVLLCAPGKDRFPEDMTRIAERGFYFDEGQRAATRSLFAKTYPSAEEADHPRGFWT